MIKSNPTKKTSISFKQLQEVRLKKHATFQKYKNELK